MRLLALAVVAIGVVGLCRIEGNVHAEDDGSGGWSVSSYFDVTVTKTTKNCELEYAGGGGYIGDGGYIVGGDESGSITSKCTDSSVEGVVRLASIDAGHDYKIVTDDHKINDIEFHKLGDGSLQVMRRGGTTLDTETWTIRAKENFSDFWSAVSLQLNGNTMTGGVLGGNITYSFKVGEIKVSDTGEAMTPAESTTTTPEDPDKIKQTCVDAGGAVSLGWIVCPIMKWLGDASEKAYDGYVKPSLSVDPQLFTGGGDDGVRGGWSTFRNIANVLFIILFLLVIVSQLTGVGIDNYGIKKILPKMIVAAILINLSYWICLAAVDVSNILGNSFQAMFDGLGANLGDLKLELDESNANGAVIAKTSITGVLVLGILVGMAGAIWTNPAVVLSLLVAALGVAISIFFLFILLAAREAAIIVLMVLSPLAVTCYMLPNTKSLFDKWLKIFEGLLLVYPIAGLLVGGGNYVSRLLLSAGFGGAGLGGFLKALTAIVVGIMPIFFIPTVLKNSFAAMGQLGAKISGIGQRVSGAATGAARNSQAYKNAQERGLERRTRIQAGVDANGNLMKMNALQRAMRGGSRNIARNRSQYLSNQESRAREANLMGTGFASAAAGIEARAGAQVVSDYEALIGSGNVTMDDGSRVNANDMGSMQRYHAQQLAAYADASARGDNAAMGAAMAQIKAAQNIMSKSSGGRDEVQKNIATAVVSGQTAGLDEAASHLMSNFGDAYKSKNRGSFNMMSDLASGTKNMSDVANAITGHQYDMAGTDKYDAGSLVGADEAALDGLMNNLGNMNASQLRDIQATANNALSQYNSGTLSIKPEVLAKINNIATYQGPPTPHNS